jgi:hypothetical protein
MLPPPALVGDTPYIGPVIDPKFVDALDWSGFLPAHETKRVRFKKRDMSRLDEAINAAPAIALESARVSELLDNKRHEVVGVGTRSLDRETEVPVVTLYDYTSDVAIEVLVDVAKNSVIDVAATENLPALAEAEEERALAIVREDGRLAEYGIDVATGKGLIVEEVNFRSPQYGHRLVDLRFAAENQRVPTAFAVVDLSAEGIVTLGLIERELS